jgi:hypothetical protein
VFDRGLVSFQDYSTVRAAGGAVCPLGGLGYYEVEVLCPGDATQFGFCSLDWLALEGESDEGVGDDGPSWGVDGDRVLRWHKGSQGPFGRRWRAGDVVGLACDLRANGGGRMLASLNGDFGLPHGAAFDLPTAGLERGLCPALTAQSGLFRCNLGGGRPFRHAPPSPEYRGMADLLHPVRPAGTPAPHHVQVGV